MKVDKFKRIVIKIGSNILTDEDGKLDLNNLRRLVDQISTLHKKGKEVIVVTSGSIVCGSEKLGIKANSIREKQAAAAIGQILLMDEYNQFFRYHSILIAQMLLTNEGLHNRERMKNARNTINTLLSKKVIPIINENDSVVIEEIKFGDNDNLSAYVAELVDADFLMVLTDTDGLYKKDPRVFSDGVLIEEVGKVDESIMSLCGDSSSGKGTGGMYSKVVAASKALECGIEVVIANGRNHDVIDDVFKGSKVGTRFIISKS